MKDRGLIDAVAQVMDNKYPEDSYNFKMQPMDDIVETMKNLGFEVDEDEIDTNGWQVDFWLYCFKDGIKYLIDGSWYYGNYKFSKV
jgi:hypothetical protein